MIIVQHVLIAFLFSEIAGLANEIDSFVCKQGRHANSRELKMLGAEIVPLLRFGSRNDDPTLPPRVSGQRIFKCVVTESYDAYVESATPDVDAVDSDVCQGPSQRIERL